MTLEYDRNVEADLQHLTQWSGSETALWRLALQRTRPKGFAGRSLLTSAFRWQPSAAVVGSLVFGCLFIVAAIINLPYLSRARSPIGTSSTIVASNFRGTGQAMYIYAQDDPGTFPAAAARSPTNDMWNVIRANNSTQKQFISPSTTDNPDRAQDTAPFYAFQRQVIRKSTIELKSADVRTAFLKAQHIARPADGEYVESSSLHGAGPSAYAQLVLRVATTRLSDVLNELRQLGDVAAENQEGQDVTASVVDVESRLRNERSVEAEVLRLLESRKDAPLKDVLELREKLGQIRSEIERLTGQRESYDRLVTLATVLVVIRAAAAPPPAPAGLGSYFSDAIRESWTGGLIYLSDTLATMLKIIVGGLVWWVLLGAGIWAIRRARSKSRSG